MQTESASEATAEDRTEKIREDLLQAAIPNVVFDGWSEVTFRTALKETGVAPGLAAALFPRGGLDLALEFHRQGDVEMARRLAGTDLAALRYSERVARAICTRLQLIEDRELVRRASTLFALPQHAAEGARAIWGTADAIWTALGDTSRDFNWYSKRATLSAVYGASVLFWLGDDSPNHIATWEFVDRRIEDVMRIEKMKAGFRNNPLSRALRDGPFSGAVNLMERVRMPEPRHNLPGQLNRKKPPQA